MISRFLMPALLLLLVLALAVAGWRTHQVDNLRADFATYRTNVEQQARLATEAARAAEAQIHIAQQKVINAANLATTAALADADRARSAADRLRQRSRTLAATSCPAADPGAIASGPPADTPADLLADLLGRVDSAAGEIGRYADQARIAGRACERSYDALIPDKLQ